MNKTNSIKKSKNELRRQFINSISYIKELVNLAMSKEYKDPLREEFAKSIAVKLRTLIIDGASKSLVTQLDINKKILFPPLCVKLNDLSGNMIHSFGLIGETFDGRNHYYFSNYERNKTELRCTLSCWLDEIVFDRKQNAIHKVSRKDIILDLADKEGGAHLDPSFEDEYYHIVYGIGYESFNEKGEFIRSQNNRFSEAIITIAREFIEAVDEYFDVLMGATYYVLEKDLTLVELVYKDKNVRKKFFHNQGKNILMCFMFAFDYMNIVEYKLLFSKNYIFVKNNKQYFRRVIDDSECLDALFCICLLDTFVFVKIKNKYCRIERENDLYSLANLKHFTFSQAIRLITENKHSNLDCLSKQIIYNEHKKE